jgi:hypothetical protein
VSILGLTIRMSAPVCPCYADKKDLGWGKVGNTLVVECKTCGRSTNIPWSGDNGIRAGYDFIIPYPESPEVLAKRAAEVAAVAEAARIRREAREAVAAELARVEAETAAANALADKQLDDWANREDPNKKPSRKILYPGMKKD